MLMADLLRFGSAYDATQVDRSAFCRRVEEVMLNATPASIGAAEADVSR